MPKLSSEMTSAAVFWRHAMKVSGPAVWPSASGLAGSAFTVAQAVAQGGS